MVVPEVQDLYGAVEFQEVAELGGILEAVQLVVSQVKLPQVHVHFQGGCWKPNKGKRVGLVLLCLSRLGMAEPPDQCFSATVPRLGGLQTVFRGAAGIWGRVIYQQGHWGMRITSQQSSAPRHLSKNARCALRWKKLQVAAPDGPLRHCA